MTIEGIRHVTGGIDGIWVAPLQVGLGAVRSTPRIRLEVRERSCGSILGPLVSGDASPQFVSTEALLEGRGVP